MSVRAYRVNKILTRKTHSFNLWNDDTFCEALPHSFWHMLNENSVGIAEIEVDTLERILADLRDTLSPETLISLWEDVAWAHAHDADYLQYSCY